MAIQIDTNTQSREEVTAAFAAHGLVAKDVEEPKKPVVAPKAEVKVETNSTEPAGEPGEKIPAETAGGTAAEVEGKETTQVADPAPTQNTPEKKKSKGGFQAKTEKLTKLVNEQSEKISELELLLEAGANKKLSQELTEAKEELTRLKGGEAKAEPTKETGPVRPKRPEMPDLADFEYDQDKYATAVKKYRTDMNKYDEDLDAYQLAVADKKSKEAVAAENTRQQQAREQAENDKAVNAFVVRKDKDVAEIGEEVYQDLLDNEPKWAEFSAVLPQAIVESDIPGHLMMYLYEHPEELERISEITDHLGRPNPVRQLREIGKIEDKIIAELKVSRNGKTTEKKPVAAAAAVAATETAETVPPAKPKPRVETPEAPLRPVGARTAGTAAIDYRALQEAAIARGDTKEYRRLRTEEHKASLAKQAR